MGVCSMFVTGLKCFVLRLLLGAEWLVAYYESRIKAVEAGIYTWKGVLEANKDGEVPMFAVEKLDEYRQELEYNKGMRNYWGRLVEERNRRVLADGASRLKPRVRGGHQPLGNIKPEPTVATHPSEPPPSPPMSRPMTRHGTDILRRKP